LDLEYESTPKFATSGICGTLEEIKLWLRLPFFGYPAQKTFYKAQASYKFAKCYHL